jgi:hypothetical protein
LLFYLLFFAVPVALRLMLGQNSPRQQFVYRIVLAAFFILSAFRHEIGCDWFGYREHYLDQQPAGFGDALSKPEWLWFFFLECLDQLGLDYVWANIVTSAVFFYGISVFARRQPDPLGFLVLLFPILIINLPMSGIRQAAAIGLICIAFTAFMDRRLFRFVFWVAIAASLHTSAVLFLLFAPLCLRTNMSQGVRVLLTALCALPGVWVMMGARSFDVALARYVDTSIQAAGAWLRVPLVAGTGMIFFLFRRRWQMLFPADVLLMTAGALMMIGCLVLLTTSSVIADRYGYYLVPLQIAMLTRFQYLVSGSNRFFAYVGPYLLIGGAFVFWMLNSSLFDRCYVPYETWIFSPPAGFP